MKVRLQLVCTELEQDRAVARVLSAVALPNSCAFPSI